MSTEGQSANRRLNVEILYSLVYVAFYTILVNLPFWEASRWLGIEPLGRFTLEYVGVGLVALFVPQILAAVLLLVLTLADLLSGVSATYYIPPVECLTAIGSLRNFASARLFAVAAVVVLILLATGFTALFPMSAIRGRYRSCAAGALIMFAVVTVSLDCALIVHETGGISSIFQSVHQGDAIRVNYLNHEWNSRYPIIRLIRSEKMFSVNPENPSIAKAEYSTISSAAAVAIRSAGLVTGAGTSKMPNLVIVLVESWGLSNDSFIRGSLVQSYFQPNLLSQYTVLQGVVPFYGPTVAGEARELCGSKMGFHLLVASQRELENCIPNTLASLGYRSIAVHGMDGYMFRRLQWYGRIGFQEHLFRDQFRQQGLPDCVGAYIGTCDQAIAEWIGQHLSKRDTSPQFVYWVTLNSHLPVPLPSQVPNGLSCALSAGLSHEPALCSWYQLVANIHYSVSLLAMTKRTRPTIFAIVGDHAPPFSNPDLRGQFSGALVPYVLLEPRQENIAPSH